MSCCEFGKMELNIDGIPYSARGTFTIKPTTSERESGANQDGSIWSSNKPVPAEAEGTLSYTCDLSPEDLFGLCDTTVVITLAGGNLIYTFVNARIDGRPEIDTETGEISGFKVVSGQVKVQKG